MHLLLSEVKCWLLVILLFLAGKAFFLFSVFWQMIGLWGNSVQGFFRNSAILSIGEAIGFGTRRELALHLKMPNHAWFASLLSNFVYVCETFAGDAGFYFFCHVLWPLVWEIYPQYKKLTICPFFPTPHPSTHDPDTRYSKRWNSHFEE